MDFSELDSAQGPRLRWSQQLRSAVISIAHDASREAEQKRVRDRMDVSLREAISDDVKTTCRGDELVRSILRTLDTFQTASGEPLVRSREQKYFHYWWIQANFPKIYKSQWHAHSERVLKNAPQLFGFPESLDRIFPEVLCLTPRRYGKTWAVAMFIAAMLYNVPGFKFATFSTGKRASGWVMRDVVSFFKQLPQARERIIKRNQEELLVSEFPLENRGSARAHTGVISEFNSFPASVDGKWCNIRSYRFASLHRDRPEKHKITR